MPNAPACDREIAGHMGPLWEIVGSVFRAYQHRKSVGFVFVLSSIQGWAWLITMGLSASAWDAHFVSCCLWLVIMQVLMSEVSAAAGWGTGASAEGMPCLGVLVCDGCLGDPVDISPEVLSARNAHWAQLCSCRNLPWLVFSSFSPERGAWTTSFYFWYQNVIPKPHGCLSPWVTIQSRW